MKGDFSGNKFNRKKHYSSVRMQQGRMQLDADWNEQMDIFDYRQQTELKDFLGTSGAPAGADAGFSITLDGGQLKIGKGRYYVDGILCENEEDVLYTAQPDYPAAALPLATESGNYLAYLDVWRRHISGIEDPDILDVALGGADTCTRLQNVAQVKLFKITGTVDEAWQAITSETTASMTPSLDESGNLGNQLYRIEVHTGGAFVDAKFKWSRDNGSIALAASLTDNTISLNNINTGAINLLLPDQWIELNSVERELQGLSGYFAQIRDIVGSSLTVYWSEATAPSFPSAQRLFIRCWESNVLAISNGGQLLENGLSVSFDPAGTYRVGDYWLMQSRSTTNQIAWPVDGYGQLIAQKPNGIIHHYTKLAQLTLSAGNTWSNLNDMRQQFPSLQGVASPDSRVLGPCHALEDLKAINVAPYIDGVLIQCRTLGLYRLDKTSTANIAEPDIVKPNDVVIPNPGRFIRITSLFLEEHATLCEATADINGLKAIPTAQLKNGSLAYSSNNGLYRLSKGEGGQSGAPPVDNYSLIASTSVPNDRWNRIAAPLAGVIPVTIVSTTNRTLNPTDINTHLVINSDPGTDFSIFLPRFISNTFALPTGFYCLISNFSSNTTVKLGVEPDSEDIIKGPNALFPGEFAILNLQNSGAPQTWNVLKTVNNLGRQERSLGVDQFYVPDTGGAVLTKRGGTNGSDILLSGYEFNVGGGQSVYALIPFAKSDSKDPFTISLQTFIDSPTTTPGVDYVNWRINAQWLNHHDGLGSFSSAPKDILMSVGDTENSINLSPASPPITPGGNSSNLLALRISRTSTGANHDLQAKAVLLGATLYINKITGNDA